MKYDLVFEGGGAKGMVFVGAMEQFEEGGYTYDRLIGSSAGAITATLLAAGYTSAEMKNALMERDENDQPIFASFMAVPPPVTKEDIQASDILEILTEFNLPLTPEFIEKRIDMAIAKGLANHTYGKHLYSLVNRGGAFVADHFLTWIKRKLNEGVYKGKPRQFGDMTMQQFYEVTGSNVSITGSDVTNSRLLIFNHQTTPDLPVIWAVRMSMSIPFLWEEVIWQSEWGEYKVRATQEKQGEMLTGNAILDGGLLSNFPIELFVSDEPYVKNVMGDKTSTNVIGFLIDDQLPVTDAPDGKNEKNKYLSLLESTQTMGRIGRIINTVTSARDKMVIEMFEDLVVRLPAKGYETTEFGMSDARRDALVDSGRQAMRIYLAELDSSISKSFDPIQNQQMQKIANKIARGILGG